MPLPIPELPPVTIAFWPFSTLLMGQAGITGSGNCSSMNFVSGVCIRPTGIVAGLSIVNVFEFIVSKEFLVCELMLVSAVGRTPCEFLTA
jgi:hypothetical protein